MILFNHHQNIKTNEKPEYDILIHIIKIKNFKQIYLNINYSTTGFIVYNHLRKPLSTYFFKFVVAK